MQQSDLSLVKVLYEDNHLIAVNKPAGWLVQADETGDATLGDLVKLWIKVRHNKPGNVFLGTIHRLDRPVTGVCLFAKTSKGLSRMNQIFQKRQVEKIYWAITTERPQPFEAKLTHYLVKDRERNVTKALERPSRRNPDAKKSTLSYRLLSSIDRHHLLEVKPETGRPHQIRTQLATAGTPIRGDLKYGSNKYPEMDGSIFLHARGLRFEHPIKKEMVEIEADPYLNPIWGKFKDFFE
ncbi:MAG: RluA family pseudouridine synthase [Bacteroidota bacterium]